MKKEKSPNYRRRIHLKVRQPSLNHKCLPSRLKTFYFLSQTSIPLPSLFFSKSSLIINSAYTEERSKMETLRSRLRCKRTPSTKFAPERFPNLRITCFLLVPVDTTRAKHRRIGWPTVYN